MAGKSGGKRQRRQQQIPGFRPGKEPPQLRQQRARQQLPKDASWSQKKMVDALGDRTPEEIQQLVGRWQTIFLIVAVVVTVLALPLYLWSVIAGIGAHLLAIGVFFLWFRMRRQQAQVAGLTGKGGPGGRKKG